MGHLKRLLIYLGIKKNKTSVEGTPNTWGHQEYQSKFRMFKKDHQLDLNNHAYRKGFIERFSSTYINVAHLKNRLNS